MPAYPPYQHNLISLRYDSTQQAGCHTSTGEVVAYKDLHPSILERNSRVVVVPQDGQALMLRCMMRQQALPEDAWQSELKYGSFACDGLSNVDWGGSPEKGQRPHNNCQKLSYPRSVSHNQVIASQPCQSCRWSMSSLAE